MPVFHTKTIESILEPVAQQVSKLVILHEEAEDGNAMPDLSHPVKAVKVAVENLVKVGNETVSSSDDQILRQELPSSLTRVHDASLFLLEANDMLQTDPYSALARKKLIEGSRGILQGTSSLLLAFDESEVRKLIRLCRQVLDYLAITEVVDNMEDLVVFVKNLSPVLTRMTKEVDAREKELTHQIHREWLVRALDEIKLFTPILISSIKIFIVNKQQPVGHGQEEAEDNREYVVGGMSGHIQEMIRVLQLTTYDEDEWDADDITVMRKLIGAIDAMMKGANDWCQDPEAAVGSVGDRSLHQILDNATKIAMLCLDEEDRETINKSVGELQSLTSALAEVRLEGKGTSAQGSSLSRGLHDKLADLHRRLKQVVRSVEKSGIRRPAPTIDGKYDEAHRWLAAPSKNDNGLGARAAHQMASDGAKMAETVGVAYKEELCKLCEEVDAMTSIMTDFSLKGETKSPAAAQLARNLSEKLYALKTTLKQDLIRQVADCYVDINTPMKQLSEAALQPEGTAGREENFREKAINFQQHSDTLTQTARYVAVGSGCKDKKLIEDIIASSHQIEAMSPQVINASNIVFTNAGNQTALEHFDLLKKQWLEQMDRLRIEIDAAIDTVAFINATEEGMKRDTELTEKSITESDPPGVVTNTSGLARRANRVLQVANQEAENSEDQNLVTQLTAVSDQLKSCIPPMVQSAKSVAVNPKDDSAARRWRAANQQILNSVGQVRKVVLPLYPPENWLPPPPPPQLFPEPPDLSQLNLHTEDLTAAPPRPPLPSDPMSTNYNHFNGPSSSSPGAPAAAAAVAVPVRPPPPPSVAMSDTEDEDEIFPLPSPTQAHQPIMQAAYELHKDVKQWSSRDNEIISATKRMALLMAKLSRYVSEPHFGGEAGSKRELIAVAKAIAEASNVVTRLAKELAGECTDKRMRTMLLQVCERIPTIGTQLDMVSTVKAAMLGAQESSTEEDIQATELLVGNAENLMQAVRETVRAAEAASIKIRVDSGYTIRWLRKRPWYS